MRIALPRSHEHDDAVAAVGALDRLAHAVVVGAEAAVRHAAGRLDAHVGAGDLAGEVGETPREVRAMRYDYDADHALLQSVDRAD